MHVRFVNKPTMQIVYEQREQGAILLIYNSPWFVFFFLIEDIPQRWQRVALPRRADRVYKEDLYV